jgi:hypothetical protein
MKRGPLTQEVEYLPFKQRVVGSSPARPTSFNAKCGVRNVELLFIPKSTIRIPNLKKVPIV